MMRTPLQSLMNLKKWKEDEAKNAFALLLKELDAEEKRLARLEAQFAALSARFERTDELLDIGELTKLNEFMDHLVITIRRQQQIVAEKERQAETARLALVEASKDRKIFERLNEKQKALSMKESKRKEQIGTDEHAVTGHTRQRDRRR